VVEKAAVVLTHDTGLMHIAAAFKRPIVSVWGNTVPQFGMTPYYGDVKVPNKLFEVSGLSCRPCSKIGFETCPKKHFRCMTQQDEAAIARAINDVV
jgi:ADP-heptose:LPS heptosyltransferase